ncbi:hypothetical protein [Streptomyces sp. NPDC058254]|uniref:hypothetical protein n=1 Tax=Streptomyces sp. NPDC058254 TaxID=3346406 RepID=UPI0036ED0629
MAAQITSHVTQAVDPADFVAELHAEGAMPQNSGGDPAVPDSAFPDSHQYELPAI